MANPKDSEDNLPEVIEDMRNVAVEGDEDEFEDVEDLGDEDEEDI